VIERVDRPADDLRQIAAAGSETPLVDELLQKSSRTFALTIPLLLEPTRSEVTVAYLLFRVADTLEDSTRWSRWKKLAELERLARFLEDPTPEEAAVLAAGWTTDPPLRHEGYLELLAELPAVMRVAGALSPEAWRLVALHTARTCRAMAGFVGREENGILRLRDVDDLRSYCYAVAGIVGEMLTELFLLRRTGLSSIVDQMRRDAPIFGEALQLVNIIKDSSADSSEGRHYLPSGLDRSDVFALARRDLETAARYCARLERAGADRGVVGFTALPVLLAEATLDRVEQHGPGAKVSRAEVATLVARLHDALEARAVGALLEATRAKRP
jgi:farnesyl-diphosphate farnesyltransferase